MKFEIDRDFKLGIIGLCCLTNEVEEIVPYTSPEKMLKERL